MTAKIPIKRKKGFLNLIYDVLKPIASALLLLVFILNSNTVKTDTYNTILFLATRLIPTLFPFAVITQIIIAQNLKLPFSRYMYKLFKIPENLLAPLILGIVCGFPIGAILVRELYKQGAAQKQEAERVIILSSQPSIAFLLMISKTEGAIFGVEKILLSSLFLVLFFLLISKNKQAENDYSDVILRQSLSFTKSITSAGEAMLNLSFFVIAFSCLGSVIKSTLKKPTLIAIILPLLEITSAVNFISSAIISDHLKLFLIPFSVGFSGLCVFMQIKNILSDTDLRIKKYIPIKLLQGLLLGLLICLF